MIGRLTKLQNIWKIRYFKKELIEDPVYCGSVIPVYPNDIQSLNLTDKNELNEVEFEIIDEFTHPELYQNVGWGDGIQYAKII